MNSLYKKLLDCYESIEEKVPFTPEVALVLGSGLGGFADSEVFKFVSAIDYKEINGFPVSTAPGHKGRFVFGYVNDVPVVCMQGRVHYYEGYSFSDVVLPHRMMKLMGAKKIILTNAAGGINSHFTPGSLMLVTEHITSFVGSPLIGPNIDELGVRFPDMTCVYDEKLRELALSCAKRLNIELKQGVYLQTKGPNYETPAEIRMYKLLGADAVGMSTAVEAQVAHHMDMQVIGISCISNMAAGLSNKKLNEQEVIESAKSVSDKFVALISEIIKELGTKNV